MKKSIIGVSAGLALCLSSYAFASGDHYTHASPYAKSGFEVGVDAGYVNYAMPGYMIFGDGGANGFAAGAHIAYNWAMRNHPNLLLGAEFGYKWLGKHDDYLYDGTEFNQQALDLLLTAKYYVYEGFNLFGKAGMALVHQKTDYPIGDIEINNFNINIPDFGDTIWGIRPEIAIGAGYTFYKHLDVHASYVHIASDADSTSIVGSNTVLGGLSFVF